MHATVAEKPFEKHAATWAGLCISLFGMALVRQVFRSISTEPSPAIVLARECCLFLAAAGLLWIMRRGEHLPLRSVGIGTAPLWKSLAWGLVVAICCLLVPVVISALTGYGREPSSTAHTKLPLWLVTIVVVRAGLVEELFYRGYAIERLQLLGFGRWISWLVPLFIFALLHWTGGIAGVFTALVLGAILTAFYQWRRDLLANIFGHFLADFVVNVGPALFG